MKISTPPKTEQVASRSPANAARAAQSSSPILRARSGPSPVAEDGEDKITLSSTAAQLIELANASEDAEAAHQNRVAQLKEQVAHDQYTVNPARVANAMVRDIVAQGGGVTQPPPKEESGG